MGEGSSHLPAPEHSVVTRELVWASIEKLPDHYRVAIVLHYFEDRSLADIAEIIDVPLGTAKSWLHRARSGLAVELGQEGASIEGGETIG